MSLPYVCGRCARQITLKRGKVSRSFNSLGRVEVLDENAITHEEIGSETRLSYDQGTLRQRGGSGAREEHLQPGAREKTTGDGVLENLFSSVRAQGAKPTTSRYSRTPVAQRSQMTKDRALLSVPTSTHTSHSHLGSLTTPENSPKPPKSEVQQPPTVKRSAAPESVGNGGPSPTYDRTSRDQLRRDHGRFRSANERKSKMAEVDWMSNLMKDIDNAVKTSNAKAAVETWTRAQRELEKEGIDQDQVKLDNLFTKFLSAFFELRRAETATSVWNHMVRRGSKITKIHWNAMLHGCIRAHDAFSLQEIWGNMRKSDVIPDTATWTTYVRGLIKCRQWPKGIDALDQLGRIWKSRTDDRKPRRHRLASPKAAFTEEKLIPSLAPVNAALDALIDIEKYDLTDHILSWASSHGLHPDIHTYNILLRPLARSGDSDAVQSHLSNMSTNHCQPDITTFTMILSSLVSSPNSNFRKLSAEQQESTLISLLNDMQVADISPNSYTYSALISGLLQPPSTNRKYHPSQPRSATTITTANISAAHTILAHMHRNSIEPTPHTYTILLSHYFLQSPPDLEAIHTLWRSVESSPLGAAKLADPIFYDRMIEGLAEAGQAEDSLKFVVRMVKDGKVPGWVALGRCLEALQINGKLVHLRWLVEEVERPGGLLKWGERELRGKGWWGRKVAELRNEGVVPEPGDGGNEGFELGREAT